MSLSTLYLKRQLPTLPTLPSLGALRYRSNKLTDTPRIASANELNQESILDRYMSEPDLYGRICDRELLDDLPTLHAALDIPPYFRPRSPAGEPGLPRHPDHISTYESSGSSPVRLEELQSAVTTYGAEGKHSSGGGVQAATRSNDTGGGEIARERSRGGPMRGRENGGERQSEDAGGRENKNYCDSGSRRPYQPCSVLRKGPGQNSENSTVVEQCGGPFHTTETDDEHSSFYHYTCPICKHDKPSGKTTVYFGNFSDFKSHVDKHLGWMPCRHECGARFGTPAFRSKHEDRECGRKRLGNQTNAQPNPPDYLEHLRRQVSEIYRGYKAPNFRLKPVDELTNRLLRDNLVEELKKVLLSPDADGTWKKHYDALDNTNVFETVANTRREVANTSAATPITGNNGVDMGELNDFTNDIVDKLATRLSNASHELKGRFMTQLVSRLGEKLFNDKSPNCEGTTGEDQRRKRRRSSVGSHGHTKHLRSMDVDNRYTASLQSVYKSQSTMPFIDLPCEVNPADLTLACSQSPPKDLIPPQPSLSPIYYQPSSLQTEQQQQPNSQVENGNQAMLNMDHLLFGLYSTNVGDIWPPINPQPPTFDQYHQATTGGQWYHSNDQLHLSLDTHGQTGEQGTPHSAPPPASPHAPWEGVE